MAPKFTVEQYSDEYLSSVVVLPDGRAAWPICQADGMAKATFVRRWKRGWSPARIVSQPVRQVRPADADEAAEAEAFGFSIMKLRSRKRAAEAFARRAEAFARRVAAYDDLPPGPWDDL